MYLYKCLLLSVLALPVYCQTIVGLSDGDQFSGRLNSAAAQQRPSQEKKTTERGVVVFIGDRVIPQFVDGAGWQTTITTVNLENFPTTFDVFFLQDNGNDLFVPIVGFGTVRGMRITLNTAGSFTFSTGGGGAALAQGWALISKPNNDSVGGLAIFKQHVDGRPDQEAVVPIVNQFSNHFVLLFDNTNFTTAIALSNPTLLNVSIPVAMRNEAGVIIDRQSIALGPYGHTAFSVPAQWASTRDKRGTIEFQTSGFGVGALGLRFSGSAFTSFHVLENFVWSQQ